MAEAGPDAAGSERRGAKGASRARWLDAVIVIAVVAGLVVVFAIAAAPQGGLYTCVNCDGKPAVALVLNGTSTAGADIRIASAAPLEPPSKFLLNLEIGTTFGSARWLPNATGALLAIRVNASTYTLAWHDADGSHTLSPGDDFSVAYPTGVAAPPPGTSLTLLLIWWDGSTLVTRSWSV